MSDGHARTEAVASLLLSEHHLRTETVQPTATSATTTIKHFLDTREALCLGADVSAHIHPHAHGFFSPGAVALVPDGSDKMIEEQAHSGLLPRFSKHHHTKVSVDSVLRELGEENEERKRRLLRRGRRRRRRRGEQNKYYPGHPQRQSDDDTGGIDDDDDLHNDEQQLDELDTGKEEGLRDECDDDRWPPDSRNPTAGSQIDNGKGNAKNTVSLPGLALAASVSTLDGLLGNSSKGRAACG